jgi:iron complex transport system substrate-binding protein
VRIVSLLPSTTEIVFALGAGDDLAGVTVDCDYPPAARDRRIVSGSALPTGLTPAQIDAAVRQRLAAGEDLYHLDEGALAGIDPDLILTQDLCEVCAVNTADVDQALAHLGCDGRVLTVDPGTLDEVIESVSTVGVAIGRAERAAELVGALRARLAAVAHAVAGRPRSRVAVLEWIDPPFAAGHWVPDMVTAAGGINVIGTSGARSQTTSWDEIGSAAPEVLVVAPCGYHLDAAAEQARTIITAGRVPDGAEVWAVDADAAFVRPGPRLVDGTQALAAALHPGALPAQPDLARRIR